MIERPDWPSLPFEEWADTCGTLHLWTQIVGKIRLAHTPAVNHWWNVPLYVTSRGLTTSLMFHGSRGFQIDFDFIDHRLNIRMSRGEIETLALAPRSVADFHGELMAKLRGLDLETSIWTMPVEIPDAIPFEQDNEHASYDPEYANRFWRVLLQVDRLLKQFRSRFIGKVSPVHFFWGSFDMAVTRFSGRSAPALNSDSPNLGRWVMREAYSHEVSSCGFWPGNGGYGKAAFYSYAYPEPPGFAQASVPPAATFYDQSVGQFILPYDAVRQAQSPDEDVMRYLQSTYEAARPAQEIGIDADWNERMTLFRPGYPCHNVYGRFRKGRRMNVQVTSRPLPAPANASKLATADCDIHPQRSNDKALHPYLEKRWLEHMQTFGARPRQAYQKGPAYPKGQPNASRRDAYPPEGGRQGSSLSFMQKQLLDQNNCVLGILNPTGDNGQSYQNREFGAAVCHAMNEWVLHEWLEPEPRLKGSIVVPYEDADAAVAELEKYAGDPHFAQVLMLSRTSEPPGQKRYWKLYEAAAAAGLPVGVHAFGFGGYPVSGSGWPSYYIEDMVGHAQSSQAFVTSMVIEGVFERIPNLQLVMIEAGFAWLPSLSWRLDKIWNRLKVETPHLKRSPSEYIHESVFLTTQPMEEPAKREQVLDAIDWIGWDRLLFATDYPHWDYDDPDMVLPMPLPEQKRRDFFLNNAAKLYKQG